MPDELILLVVKSGIFAVLFVYLLFYVLKDAKKREIKYQELIRDLTDKLEIVEEIDSNVKTVKSRLIGQVRTCKERV